MSRELRRVPLDFEAPIGKTWAPLLRPDELDGEACGTCGGSGGSPYARWLQDRWYGKVPFDPAETGSAPLTPETPEVWAFAKRNVERSPTFYASYLRATGDTAIRREAERLCQHWNNSWSHHLHQDDVDVLIANGRLHDLTHTWDPERRWQPIEPAPVVTAEQVNRWSLMGFGHDAVNCWIVCGAACDRAGQPRECADCAGHGSTERYPGQRAEAEAWEPAEIPTGDGWQLWQTVSEGGPVSPVFAIDEELARWMVANRGALNPGDRSINFDTALSWLRGPGWAISGAFLGGKQVSTMKLALGDGGAR
jgi:hypothetical protein